MASWADQISQFNPYIQQLPVEAMTQVGMYKQQKYDEGIQKVQSYIDNVAGLDVVRDIDKAYLQSKLNELGSKLKTVAAGDFSNYQLVNSVGGMATQIVKDSAIQNAVSSTKMYRKGVEDMDKFNKEGKGSPSNDWDFNQKASKWLNSTNLDDRFSARYDPYTNYKKNALEVIKSLTKDETIKDDAFKFNSKGELVIEDAIVRKKLSGISPNKIKQALQAGLTPADWKQVEIDGRYSYANADEGSFATSLKSSYDDKINFFENQKKTLLAAKDSASSPIDKEAMQDKIAEIENTIKSVKGEYDSILGSIESGDVESAKAKLYTYDFTNGFSKAFSYTQISDTYEKSPFAEMQMEREKLNRDWKKFSLEYQLKERGLAIEERKATAAERQAAAAEKEVAGYGGLPSPVLAGDVPKVTMGKVIGNTQALRDQVDKSDAAIMNYFKQDEAWLNNQRTAWLNSPKAVDPMLAQHFNQTEPLRREAEDNAAMILGIENEANRVFKDVSSLIPKDAPNLTYTKNDGAKYLITPKDIVKFNSKQNKYIDVITSAPAGPGMPGGTRYIFNDELAKEELSGAEYEMYKIRKKETQFGKKSLNPAETIMVQNMDNYRKLVNVPYLGVLREREKFVEDEVHRRVTASQAVGYDIPTKTQIQKSSLASAFIQVADLADSQKGAVANSPNLNTTTLRDIATDPNVGGSMRVVEGTEYAPAMYEITARGSKGTTTTFRMTPEQKQAVFGDRFEASPEVRAFRPYQQMMRKFSSENSNFWSTNPTGERTNATNGKLNINDFPNVKLYGITANIESPDRGNTYSILLNIRDPLTGKIHAAIPYPGSGMMTEEQVAAAMLKLNDSYIYERLTGVNPTSSDLKLVEKASKNPL